MRDWITHLSWVTRQSWPNASRTRDYYGAGGQVRPMTKIVLHTTETVGFPGYRNGADNPHFTIDLRTGKVRQHVPLSQGSRALQITATRLANVAGVVQIEIIGAVTPGYPSRYGHYDIPNRLPKDPQAMGYLARLLRAIADETGIPLREGGLRWLKYPASYGNSGGQRLSVNAYLAYKGVLGHQHVPGNSHGDPGALPVAELLALAKGGSAPAPKPQPDDGRSGSVFFEGADGPDVHEWQRNLEALGYPLSGVGKFGPITTAATKAFQRDMGIKADGRVGPETQKAMSEHMSNLEKKIDALTQEVKALRQPPTVKQIADAVWGYVATGHGPFNAWWWQRRGAVLNPKHKAFPADPGSPADVETKVAQSVLGDDMPDPYLG